MTFYIITKLRSFFSTKSGVLDVDQQSVSNFDIVVMLLSFVAIFLFGISAFFDVDSEYRQLLQYIDFGLCVIFIIDFILDFKAAKSKKDFLKWGWMDLISSIPSVDFLRFGRIFRLLRLLKTISTIRILILHSIRFRQNAILAISFLATFIVVTFSSIAVLYFERTPESNIKTAEDAIWWTFTTITTVGYGDRFPVTSEGRVVGVITMIVGISVFSIVTAYIASIFMQQKRECKEN